MWQKLFAILLGAYKKKLIEQIQYLKVENQILRSKLPRQVDVTTVEKNRLIRYGEVIGSAINELISIVTPRTFARWLAAARNQEPRPDKKSGRAPISEETCERVIEMARNNAWGCTRIVGELKKVKISISRTSVANILRKAGIEPTPTRGNGEWCQFIRRHAQTLWACDFFTKSVWTLLGRVQIYVLFFIHIGSRKVHIAGMTSNPDGKWMAQQARNMAMIFDEESESPTILLRDFDSKFTKQFDAIMEDEEIEVKRVGPCTPNLNAFAERWVKSIRSECLEHFIVFGENHLRYLVKEYTEHYNQERPHQGLDNVPIPGLLNEQDEGIAGKIECTERLGGLLKHYHRSAA